MPKYISRKFYTLIIFVLLLGEFGFLSVPDAKAFVPVPNYDVVLNPTYGWKEIAADIAARVIGRKLLSKLTNRMIGKIQKSGREGGPAFVQDWRSFILGGQYRGEDVFRGILHEALNEAAGGKGVVCPQFKDQLAKTFGAKKIEFPDKFKQYKRIDSLQSYAVMTKCTLPKNVNNFYEDFSRGGGWETFLRTLEPQNTLAGVITISMEELNKQRKLEELADINEAISGKGYTGLRTGCEGFGENKKCAILGRVVTPPDLLGESAAETIDAELDWLTSSDEISEILVGVADSILGRITKQILGEVGLEGAGSVPEDAKPDKIDAKNFKYEELNLPTPLPVETSEPGESQIDQVCFVDCIGNRAELCNSASDRQVCMKEADNSCKQQCTTINP